MSQQSKHLSSEIQNKPTSGVTNENSNANQVPTNNNTKRFEGLTSFAAGNVCLKSRQGGTVPKFHSKKTNTNEQYQQQQTANSDQPQQVERKNFVTLQEDQDSDWLLSNGKGKKTERLEDILNQEKEASDRRDKLFQNKHIFKERYQHWCECNASSLGVDSYWNELSEQFPQIFMKRPLQPLILGEDSEYYENIEDAFEEQPKNQQQQRQFIKFDSENNINSNVAANPANHYQGFSNQQGDSNGMIDDDENNWDLDNSNMEFEFKVFDKEKHAQELQNKQRGNAWNNGEYKGQTQLKQGQKEEEKNVQEGISAEQLFEMAGMNQTEKQEEGEVEEYKLEYEDVDIRLEQRCKELQEPEDEKELDRKEEEEVEEEKEEKDEEDLEQNEDSEESQGEREVQEEEESCEDEMEEDHEDEEEENESNEQASQSSSSCTSSNSSYSNSQEVHKPQNHQQQQHIKAAAASNGSHQVVVHNGQVTLLGQQIQLCDPTRAKEIVISRHFTKQSNPQPSISDSMSSNGSRLEFDDDDEDQEEANSSDILNLHDLLGQAEEEKKNFFQAVCYYLQKDVRELIWVYKDNMGRIYGSFDSIMMDAWSGRLQDTEVSLAPQVYWVSYKQLTLHARNYALSYAQNYLLLQQNQQIQYQQQLQQHSQQNNPLLSNISSPGSSYQQGQQQQQQPFIRGYDGSNQVQLQNQITLLNQYLQELRSKQTMCQQMLNESNANNKSLVQEQLVQFEKQNAELYSQLIQITSSLPQAIQQGQQLISSVKQTVMPQQQAGLYSSSLQNAQVLQMQRSQSHNCTVEQSNVHKQASYPGVQSQVASVITKSINNPAEKMNYPAEPSLLSQTNQQQQQTEKKLFKTVEPIAQIKVAAPSNNNPKTPIPGYEKDFPSLS